MPEGAFAAGLLRFFEEAGGDDRFVGGLVGPHPLFLRVVRHAGPVSEGDLFDIDELLFLALPVPDLVAGVPGVAEDGADRAALPGSLGPMGVAGRVVRGRAGNPFAVEDGGERVGRGPVGVAL
jgi:hypothetical protein